MADPVVHLTAGVPDSGTGNITTLGQTLLDGAQVTQGAIADAAVTAGATGTISAKLRSISRDVVANIVLAAGANIIGLFKLSDGTNTAAVKAASTAPIATDPALVVAISPNSVNANGQAAMAASAPVALANNQQTLSMSQDTSLLTNGVTGTTLTPKFALITASSSGATTVVAAVTSKKLRVLAWDCKVNAAVNFKWQSHVTPTDLTGLYYCSAQGDGVARAYNPLGYFQTIAGEALDINLSGAVAVGGVITYVEV